MANFKKDLILRRTSPTATTPYSTTLELNTSLEKRAYELRDLLIKIKSRNREELKRLEVLERDLDPLQSFDDLKITIKERENATQYDSPSSSTKVAYDNRSSLHRDHPPDRIGIDGGKRTKDKDEANDGGIGPSGPPKSATTGEVRLYDYYGGWSRSDHRKFLREVSAPRYKRSWRSKDPNFIHAVWESTSGEINSSEVVEKHVDFWIKREKERNETKAAISEWKESRRSALRKNTRINSRMNTEKKVNPSKERRNRGNRAIKNEILLREWKEIREMKKTLNALKNLSSYFQSPLNREPNPRIKTRGSNTALANLKSQTKSCQNSPDYRRDEVKISFLSLFRSRDQRRRLSSKTKSAAERKKRNKNSENCDCNTSGGGGGGGGGDDNDDVGLRRNNGHNTKRKRSGQITKLTESFKNKTTPNGDEKNQNPKAIIFIDSVPKLGIPTWRQK